MPALPPGTDPDQVTAAARRVLLDALDVLRDQHDAVVLVGAQAVYLRSRDADFSTSAYTTDADLGLNPALLGDAPLLEAAMTAGGFSLRDPNQPGLWVRNEAVGGQRIDIEVDLLVPGSLAQGGRSARIPPHDRMVARRVPGLEVAIVDNDVMTVAALQAGDDRSVRVNVAGVPALLVAKAYKLGEREDQGGARLVAKDAADVYRLIATVDPFAVADRFVELVDDPLAGEVARRGLAYLHRLFGGTDTTGVRLAITALSQGGPDPGDIGTRTAAFVGQLPRPAR